MCDPKDVDIGTQAKSYLRKANITGKEKQNFQKECVEFLIATVSKIHERNPLKYKITQPISCIVPGSIINCRTVAENKIKVLVEILFEMNWISAVVADKERFSFPSCVLKLPTNGMNHLIILIGITIVLMYFTSTELPQGTSSSSFGRF